MRIRTPRPPVFAAFLAGLLALAFARPVAHPSGWVLDPPAGATLEDKDGGGVIGIRGPDGLVQGMVFTLEANRFATHREAEEFFKERMRLQAPSRTATWGGWTASFAEGPADLGKGPFLLRLAVFHKPGKGTEAVLLQCAEVRGAQTADWAASLLDSFSPEESLAGAAGLLTRLDAADARDLPPRLSSQILFGGELFAAPFDGAWVRAARHASDRETRLLYDEATNAPGTAKAPNETPGATNARFQNLDRFYRLVARASREAFTPFSLSLKTFFEQRRMGEAEQAGFIATGLRLYRTIVCNSDRILTTPFETFQEGGGNCAGKTLTAALLLEQLNLEGEFLYSLADKHAFLGLPHRYFLTPQQEFLKSTKGNGLVGLDLLEDPAATVFQPSNWRALALRYE